MVKESKTTAPAPATKIYKGGSYGGDAEAFGLIQALAHPQSVRNESIKMAKTGRQRPMVHITELRSKSWVRYSNI